MRKLLILIAFISLNGFSQSGKFAGTKKNLIHFSFSNNDLDTKLKGWTYKGGTMLNNPYDNSGFDVSITLYQKGTTQLAVLTKSETNSTKSIIYDVIEVTNVPKNYEFIIATCRKNKEQNVEIVALAKLTNTEFLNQIFKAFRCNLNKMQFEFLEKKGVDCINEGLD